MLVSTVVTPIARVHWTSVFLEFFDHELYFVWGTYSLYRHRARIYGSRWNPYTSLGLPYLVVLWIACGIVLSVIILYSSRTNHRPRVVWVVVASLYLTQILLPFSVFDALKPWVFTEYTTYLLPLPIPSVLTIVALVALRQMRKQPASSNVGPEYTRTS